MIVANLILLNVFSMTLLQQFEDFYKNDYNPITIYKNHLHNFKLGWMKFCCTEDKNFMNLNHAIKFYHFIGNPLGFLIFSFFF